jgi:uncharacterized membrane protein
MNNWKEFVYVGLSALLSVFLFIKVGWNESIPIHWGLDGKPNGFAPSWLFITLYPLFVLLIVHVVKKRSGNPEKLIGGDVDLTVLIASSVLLVMQLVIIALSTEVVSGNPLYFSIFILGALISVVGNYYSKTLANEEYDNFNGRKNESNVRLRVGTIMFLVGVLTLLVGFIGLV